MKTRLQLSIALTLLSILNHPLSTLHAQGTAFTYQGRLNDGTNVANGKYDFQFYLRDAAAGGNPAGQTNIISALGVTNGLFTVALDFNNQFSGADRWLEFAVRTNGAASFTTLAPRQKLTPTPYAIFANTASNVSGTISAANLSGTYGNALVFNNAGNSFTGGGSGLTGVNAATLNGLAAGSFWQTGGNTGTAGGVNFIGTTDNQPLELRVNGTRGLRLLPSTVAGGAPNVIGGASVNFSFSTNAGATIGGGGGADTFGAKFTNSVTADLGTVTGGGDNHALAGYAMVGGGVHNTASGVGSTVGGGNGNVATNDFSTVGGGAGNFAVEGSATVGGGAGNVASDVNSTVAGGFINSALSYSTVIGGGYNNTASNDYAVVSGGYVNNATGTGATVPGGLLNIASGTYSFAAGNRAQALKDGSFVWADTSVPANFASTATNQFLIRAAGGVGINNNNPQAPLHITGGGDANLTSGGNIISGLSTGQNLVIDNNEIISRNNGTASDLVLNSGSGNVGIGRTPSVNRLEVGGEASKSTAGSWLANSDARIKTDVQTVTNAIDKISRVRLVQFRYTEDYRISHPEVADREYLNVVAQEFQKVFPEHVKHSGEKLANGDDILQVDTYPLTIYSAAAVQELNEKLTSELKRRDAENAELKLRLERLEKLISKN